MNICRKARVVGSAGVHKYAVNLGLSAFISARKSGFGGIQKSLKFGYVDLNRASCKFGSV